MLFRSCATASDLDRLRIRLGTNRNVDELPPGSNIFRQPYRLFALLEQIQLYILFFVTNMVPIGFLLLSCLFILSLSARASLVLLIKDYFHSF